MTEHEEADVLDVLLRSAGWEMLVAALTERTAAMRRLLLSGSAEDYPAYRALAAQVALADQIMKWPADRLAALQSNEETT